MSHDVLHSLFSQLLLYFLLIGSLSSLSGCFLTTRICTPVLCMVTGSLYKQSCKLNPVNYDHVYKLTYGEICNINDGIQNSWQSIHQNAMLKVTSLPQSYSHVAILNKYNSLVEPDSQPKLERVWSLSHIQLVLIYLNFRGR